MGLGLIWIEWEVLGLGLGLEVGVRSRGFAPKWSWLILACWGQNQFVRRSRRVELRRKVETPFDEPRDAGSRRSERKGCIEIAVGRPDATINLNPHIEGRSAGKGFTPRHCGALPVELQLKDVA